MAEKFHVHELTLPATVAGGRLDQALAAALPTYSRAALQRWIREGEVLVEGHTVRPSDRVRGGEAVRVRAVLREETQVAPESIPLAIVHEDADLIVIDKPAGLVVHPGAGNREHTLQNALLAHDPALARVPRSGIVHRLDRDTSGLLVVARTPAAHARLTAALKSRTIGREYLALCRGVLSAGGSVDAAIGRHRTARTRMAVRRDGRPAITHYRVAERFRAHTLLAVRLETGRTHQIRVHLAHLHHPIVGDPDYGGRARRVADAGTALNARLAGFRRQALHAARLTLHHPGTGAEVTFTAPPPADFRGLLDALRRDARRAKPSP